MKKILTFGTFDGVHQGHLHYLKKSKSYGDFLIVVVGRDETVKNIKGKFPKYSEKNRVNNLKQIDFVDKVVLGNLLDPYKVILDIKPDIICIGYDQNSFTDGLQDFLKKNKLNSKIIKIDSYFPEKFKSSLLNKYH